MSNFTEAAREEPVRPANEECGPGSIRRPIRTSPGRRRAGGVPAIRAFRLATPADALQLFVESPVELFPLLFSGRLLRLRCGTRRRLTVADGRFPLGTALREAAVPGPCADQDHRRNHRSFRHVRHPARSYLALSRCGHINACTSRPPAAGIDVAGTNPVAAVIAQGHVRPVLLRFSHADCLRRELRLPCHCRAISRMGYRLTLFCRGDRARGDKEREERQYHEIAHGGVPVFRSATVPAAL